MIAFFADSHAITRWLAFDDIFINVTDATLIRCRLSPLASAAATGAPPPFRQPFSFRRRLRRRARAPRRYFILTYASRCRHPLSFSLFSSPPDYLAAIDFQFLRALLSPLPPLMLPLMPR